MAVGAGGDGGGGISANPSLITNQVVLEPGEDCPTGGVEIFYGIDENGDGTLNDSERAGSEIICNGATGDPGDTGPAGATGEDGATGPTGGDGGNTGTGTSEGAATAAGAISLTLGTSQDATVAANDA
ncbi:MAG: hypothetical protein IID61_08915, partial [SAR324 cluster bacterium]|nr:hypothetical protein [SAR324 cluster bacterium]